MGEKSNGLEIWNPFFEFSVEFRVGLYFISFSQLIVFLYMKKTTGIIPTVVFRHNGWAIFWRSIFDLWVTIDKDTIVLCIM